jgi:hypothetical protein
LAQGPTTTANIIHDMQDMADDTMSLAGNNDGRANRTESEASAGHLSTLKDGASAVVADAFFPLLTATSYGSLLDLEHLTFPSQLYGLHMEHYEWTTDKK